MRISPKYITKIRDNEIFVFGSNESGRHGKGAAKTAIKWGAIYGISEGIQGNTYAIPTKDVYIKNTLSISEIKLYVDNFVKFAIDNSELNFLVTEIGCGLAGLSPYEVAPLFIECVEIVNIYLPKSFYDTYKD
jgi:hypothetical protein